MAVTDVQTCGQRRYPASTKVAVVVSGWPRVSETFALNELLALHDNGMLAAVFATKAGDTSLVQPGWKTLDPLVTVLPDVPVPEQGALVAQALQPHGVSAVHGYFAHQPAAVAADAAERLGIPYSFSVHALDARKVAPDELARRASGAAVVVACNHDSAAAIEAVGVAPTLLPHGVDLGRFTMSPPPSGTDVRLLAVV